GDAGRVGRLRLRRFARGVGHRREMGARPAVQVLPAARLRALARAGGVAAALAVARAPAGRVPARADREAGGRGAAARAAAVMTALSRAGGGGPALERDDVEAFEQPAHDAFVSRDQLRVVEAGANRRDIAPLGV